MLAGLVKLILVVIVVVALGAFFLGYRWAGPERVVDSEPDRPEATGTTGALEDGRERAREVGAEIGENVAQGTEAAQRAVSNAQVTAKIKSKMALDEMVSAMDIDVDTREGVVTLSGTVGSDAQRERALQLARETDGVTSVVDRLDVQ
jgi:osmotically-inducible protein OsmY